MKVVVNQRHESVIINFFYISVFIYHINFNQYRDLRCEEVVLNRLHIGHTCITHRYLITRTDKPTCQMCNMELTVKHIT